MNKNLYSIIIIKLFLFFIPIAVFAQGKQTVVIDTPTAYTISRGTYKFSFLEYDSGGVEAKTFLGLHDIFFLGASFDIQNAIGKEDAHFNIPGVIARIKFTDGWESFPVAIAMGYDSFYLGSNGRSDTSSNSLNRVIYGPYLVFTGSIYLFDSQQYLSFGLRTPTQPDYRPKETSYFSSIDIPLGDYFRFMLETERIYWNFKDASRWLYNVGLKYNYMDHIGIEVALVLQPHEKPNRVVRIEYHGSF